MAMTKRNRVNDTQPMLGRPLRPADNSDATDPGDPTIPTGPPPITLPPYTTSVAPPLSPDEAREATDLLAAFKQQPLAPPAPRPKQQASSEGGDFVAYSTVTRPAPRSGGAVPDQSLVDVRIARLAALPDSVPPAQGGAPTNRQDGTHLVAARRGGLGALPILLGVGTVLVVAGLVAMVVLTLESRNAERSSTAAPTPVVASGMPSPAVSAAPSGEAAHVPLPTASAAAVPPAPSEVGPAPSALPPTKASTPATSAPTGSTRPPPAKRNGPSSDQFTW
jgi:hypothetical protein